nr:nuclear transport factor 2 family protein [Mycolicibacterium malmesburyense]CRL77898.1 hypothetical protein CPGR_04451 [Mycolicibacterium malmesburyense]
MSESIERLMESNLLRVFNERDADRRRAAIADTYSPEVRWTDDEGVCVGHEALDAKAQALQDGQLAGLSFIKAGPVHQTRGFGISPGMSSLPAPRRPSSRDSTSRSSMATTSPTCSR